MYYRRVQISTQRPWALEHVHIKVAILAYISAYQGHHIIIHTCNIIPCTSGPVEIPGVKVLARHLSLAVGQVRGGESFISKVIREHEVNTTKRMSVKLQAKV